MKLSTIAKIAGVVVGAVSVAVYAYSKATTDVEVDETTDTTTEVETEPTVETTTEA